MHIHWIVLLFFYQLEGSRGLRKFYMEDDCNGVINMESSAIASGRLTVTRRSKYRSTLDCHVTIVAPLNRKIGIVFREMDIEWEVNCDDDFVSLHDGSTVASPIIQGTEARICGHKIPSGHYATKGHTLTVLFQSDVYKQNNGFEIVFTAFHTAQSCMVDELRCHNGRCISASLRCNNFNNCGDNSDECKINLEVAIAIILSVFLLTVIGAGSVLMYKKRAQKAKQQKLKSAVNERVKTGIELGTPDIQPYGACSQKIMTREEQIRYYEGADRHGQTDLSALERRKEGMFCTKHKKNRTDTASHLAPRRASV